MKRGNSTGGGGKGGNGSTLKPTARNKTIIKNSGKVDMLSHLSLSPFYLNEIDPRFGRSFPQDVQDELIAVNLVERGHLLMETLADNGRNRKTPDKIVLWRAVQTIGLLLLKDITTDKLGSPNAMLAALALTQFSPEWLKGMLDMDGENFTPEKVGMVFNLLRFLTAVLARVGGAKIHDTQDQLLAQLCLTITTLCASLKTGGANFREIEDILFPKEGDLIAGAYITVASKKGPRELVRLYPMVSVIEELGKCYKSKAQFEQDKLRRCPFNDPCSTEVHLICVSVFVISHPSAKGGETNAARSPRHSQNVYYFHTLSVLVDIVYYPPSQLSRMLAGVVGDIHAGEASRSSHKLNSFFNTALNVWIPQLVVLAKKEIEIGQSVETTTQNFLGGYEQIVKDANKRFKNEHTEGFEVVRHNPCTIQDLMEVLLSLRRILTCGIVPHWEREAGDKGFRKVGVNKAWGFIEENTAPHVFPRERVNPIPGAGLPYFVDISNRVYNAMVAEEEANKIPEGFTEVVPRKSSRKSAKQDEEMEHNVGNFDHAETDPELQANLNLLRQTTPTEATEEDSPALPEKETEETLTEVRSPISTSNSPVSTNHEWPLYHGEAATWGTNALRMTYSEYLNNFLDDNTEDPLWYEIAFEDGRVRAFNRLFLTYVTELVDVNHVDPDNLPTSLAEGVLFPLFEKDLFYGNADCVELVLDQAYLMTDTGGPYAFGSEEVNFWKGLLNKVVDSWTKIKHLVPDKGRINNPQYFLIQWFEFALMQVIEILTENTDEKTLPGMFHLKLCNDIEDHPGFKKISETTSYAALPLEDRRTLVNEEKQRRDSKLAAANEVLRIKAAMEDEARKAILLEEEKIKREEEELTRLMTERTERLKKAKQDLEGKKAKRASTTPGKEQLATAGQIPESLGTEIPAAQQETQTDSGALTIPAPVVPQNTAGKPTPPETTSGEEIKEHTQVLANLTEQPTPPVTAAKEDIIDQTQDKWTFNPDHSGEGFSYIVTETRPTKMYETNLAPVMEKILKTTKTNLQSEMISYGTKLFNSVGRHLLEIEQKKRAFREKSAERITALKNLLSNLPKDQISKLASEHDKNEEKKFQARHEEVQSGAQKSIQQIYQQMLNYSTKRFHTLLEREIGESFAGIAIGGNSVYDTTKQSIMETIVKIKADTQLALKEFTEYELLRIEDETEEDFMRGKELNGYIHGLAIPGADEYEKQQEFLSEVKSRMVELENGPWRSNGPSLYYRTAYAKLWAMGEDTTENTSGSAMDTDVEGTGPPMDKGQANMKMTGVGPSARSVISDITYNIIMEGRPELKQPNNEVNALLTKLYRLCNDDFLRKYTQEFNSNHTFIKSHPQFLSELFEFCLDETHKLNNRKRSGSENSNERCEPLLTPIISTTTLYFTELSLLLRQAQAWEVLVPQLSACDGLIMLALILRMRVARNEALASTVTLQDLANLISSPIYIDVFSTSWLLLISWWESEFLLYPGFNEFTLNISNNTTSTITIDHIDLTNLKSSLKPIKWVPTSTKTTSEWFNAHTNAFNYALEEERRLKVSTYSPMEEMTWLSLSHLTKSSEKTKVFLSMIMDSRREANDSCFSLASNSSEISYPKSPISDLQTTEAVAIVIPNDDNGQAIIYDSVVSAVLMENVAEKHILVEQNNVNVVKAEFKNLRANYVEEDDQISSPSDSIVGDTQGKEAEEEEMEYFEGNLETPIKSRKSNTLTGGENIIMDRVVKALLKNKTLKTLRRRPTLQMIPKNRSMSLNNSIPENDLKEQEDNSITKELRGDSTTTDSTVKIKLENKDREELRVLLAESTLIRENQRSATFTLKLVYSNENESITINARGVEELEISIDKSFGPEKLLVGELRLEKLGWLQFDGEFIPSNIQRTYHPNSRVGSFTCNKEVLTKLLVAMKLDQQQALRHTDSSEKGLTKSNTIISSNYQGLHILLAEDTKIRAGSTCAVFTIEFLHQLGNGPKTKIPIQVLDNLVIQLNPNFGPEGSIIKQETIKGVTKDMLRNNGGNKPTITLSFPENRHVITCEAKELVGSCTCDHGSLQEYFDYQVKPTKHRRHIPTTTSAKRNNRSSIVTYLGGDSDSSDTESSGTSEPEEEPRYLRVKKGANSVSSEEILETYDSINNEENKHKVKAQYKNEYPHKNHVMYSNIQKTPDRKMRDNVQKKLKEDKSLKLSEDVSAHASWDHQLVSIAIKATQCLLPEQSNLEGWERTMPQIVWELIEPKMQSGLKHRWATIENKLWDIQPQNLWDINDPPAANERNKKFKKDSFQDCFMQLLKEQFTLDVDKIQKLLHSYPGKKIKNRAGLDGLMTHIQKFDSWLPEAQKTTTNGIKSYVSILIDNLDPSIKTAFALQRLYSTKEVQVTGYSNSHLDKPFKEIMADLNKILLCNIGGESASSDTDEEDTSTTNQKDNAKYRAKTVIGSLTSNSGDNAEQIFERPQDLDKRMDGIVKILDGVQKNLSVLIDASLNNIQLPPGLVSSHHEKSIRPDPNNPIINPTPTQGDKRRDPPPTVSFAEGQSKVAEQRSNPPWNQSNRFTNKASNPGMSLSTRSSSPSNRGEKQQGVCWDFQKGTCNRGTSCRFLHSMDSSDPKPTASVMAIQQIFGTTDTYEAQCKYQDLQDALYENKTDSHEEEEES